MKKEKKIKIFLGSTYVLIILSFLWVFFDNFSLSEISSYEFIKNNLEYLNQLKDNSTDDNPQEYPSGIELVIVNGQVVFENNKHCISILCPSENSRT